MAVSFNPKIPLLMWLNVTLSCAGFLSTKHAKPSAMQRLVSKS